MPDLQVKGPRNKEKGPVKYHTVFSRSKGKQASGLLVSITIGDKLRQCLDGRNMNTVSNGSATHKCKNPTIRDNVKNFKPEVDSVIPSARMSVPFITETSRSSNDGFSNSKTPGASSSHVNKDPEPAQDSDSDFGSDIEIVKIVPLAPNNMVNPNFWGSNQSEDDTDKMSDSELTSLDSELNNALSTVSSLASQKNLVLSQGRRAFASGDTKYPPIHEVLPDFYMPHKANAGDPPPGYRAIPPNLVYAIHRELNLWMEKSSSDDLEVTEQLIFSLKDPITRTKIMLPIKSTTCRHFECFDFKTFCSFYDLKPGLESFLKDNLVQQARDARESEALFKEQLQKMHAGKLSRQDPGIKWPNFSEHGQMFFTDIYHRTPPLYKCPLCDEKFGLKQLYISDIFNYFVRFTPKYITKVHLDGTWFKIVEDDQMEKNIGATEVVDLSDEENCSSNEKENEKENENENEKQNEKVGEPKEKKSMSHTSPPAKTSSISTSDDFDDGLDDILLAMHNGDGSWSHPLTLD